jgi:hypothetical protein
MLKKPSTADAAEHHISAARGANRNRGNHIEGGTGIIDSLASSATESQPGYRNDQLRKAGMRTP